MPIVKYAICAAAALALTAAGITITFFDEADVDIARPPSHDGDRAGAGDSAAARFIANPLDRYAVFSLAKDGADDASGPDRTRLLLLASERSLRDIEIQSAAIDHLLRKEDYPRALARLDGLIRARPSLRKKFYDVLAVFARSDASRAALIALLGESPPWRKDFFTYLPGSATDMNTISLVIAELRGAQAPLQAAEIAPFISKLIADGAPETAYAHWLNGLSETQLARAGYVYNGDFEAPLARQGAFDWVVTPAKNVVVRTFQNASAGRGTVLEVTFAGSQISYRNIYQRLMLPAGGYTLTGQYRAGNLENERGLVWRVYCESSPQQTLGESPPMKGTRDWGPLEIAFSVPEQDCMSQILRLELNARAKLDLQVRGILRFDDLRIARQE